MAELWLVRLRQVCSGLHLQYLFAKTSLFWFIIGGLFYSIWCYCFSLQYACLACCHVWYVTPYINFSEMTSVPIHKLYTICLNTYCSPLCETCGLCFSKIRVKTDTWLTDVKVKQRYDSPISMSGRDVIQHHQGHHSWDVIHHLQIKHTIHHSSWISYMLFWYLKLHSLWFCKVIQS